MEKLSHEAIMKPCQLLRSILTWARVSGSLAIVRVSQFIAFWLDVIVRKHPSETKGWVNKNFTESYLCLNHFIPLTRPNLKINMIKPILLAIIQGFTFINFNDNFKNESKKAISKSWSKINMTAICSNFFFQRVVKALIIANCIDFITSIFTLFLDLM